MEKKMGGKFGLMFAGNIASIPLLLNYPTVAIVRNWLVQGGSGSTQADNVAKVLLMLQMFCKAVVSAMAFTGVIVMVNNSVE